MYIQEGDKEKLILDQESLKAITVNTRINILKLLKEKQEILSDLSSSLSLSIPTVREHLGVLEKVGMVKKLEEGRKWKYYKLTEKGECLLNPDRKRIWITLSVLILAIVGNFIRGYFEIPEVIRPGAPMAQREPSLFSFIFILTIFISIIVLIVLGIKFLLRSRPKK